MEAEVCAYKGAKGASRITAALTSTVPKIYALWRDQARWTELHPTPGKGHSPRHRQRAPEPRLGDPKDSLRTPP